MDLSLWREWDSEYANEQKKYADAIPSRTFIMQNLQEALPLREFIAAFQLDETQSIALKQRIRAMIQAGQLQRLAKGRIQCAQEALATGKVFLHPDGYGFFTPDTGGEDGFIAPQYTATLMHGDRIRARVDFIAADGRKEYQPLEVIQRAYSHVAGTLFRQRGEWFLRSDNKRLPLFHLANKEARGFKEGDVVRAKIERYPSAYQLPSVVECQALGRHDDAHMHNRLALLNQQIPHVFPAEVLNEAEALPDSLRPEDYAGRHDFRHLPFVTIDGSDARDFDDAVCVQKTAQGWRLYVAIADVAHYVPAGSALDTEALNRGTSVYFPDMVIPMLPEALSNGLCSLNPQVDRLALVCTLSLDEEGQLKRSRFARAVIHSRQRLTYEAVHDAIFLGKSNHYSQAVSRSLQAAKALFELLLQQRETRGALNFELPEAKFQYDERGKIKSIQAAQRLPSHQLIEEFMVLANIAAAKFLEKHHLSALFRAHEAPVERNQKILYQWAREMGLHWEIGAELTPLHLHQLLQALSNHEQKMIYDYKILRLMSPAYYETHNVGHFGLALSHYCHFTSPIRRYPDLTVHRAIISQLNQNPIKNQSLAAIAAQCTEYEKRADEITRDIVKALKCEYLSRQQQRIFSGFISRIQASGLWVTLDDLFIEGLIHISQLDDYFIYDEKNETLYSKKGKTVYRLGQKLEVLIREIDLEQHKIDFLPYRQNSPSKKNKKKHSKDKKIHAASEKRKTQKKGKKK